ncbi:MAG TPA: hypothetical protein VGG51_12185 [Candidatus Cybelea sp.]|jgi:hypothetical protein
MTMHSKRSLFRISLIAAFTVGALCAYNAGAAIAANSNALAQAAPVQNGSHDFDFLFGTWLVHNRRLEKLPSGEYKWEQFDATDKYWPLAGGLGNEDVFRTDHFKKGFVGMTIRLYDATTGTWKLYWINNLNSHGDAGAPNVGKFHGNVGIFDERLIYHGKPAIDRYIWTNPGKGAKGRPHFEESISQDGGKTWKVLYTADLIRT